LGDHLERLRLLYVLLFVMRKLGSILKTAKVRRYVVRTTAHSFTP
jgi:hypothetical protein